jgi:hypothetical protein
MFPLPGHSIAWRLTLDSDSSIEVPLHDAVHIPSDDGHEIIWALFTCPYCWAEDYFFADIRNGGRLVIVCESTQREFDVRLGER